MPSAGRRARRSPAHVVTGVPTVPLARPHADTPANAWGRKLRSRMRRRLAIQRLVAGFTAAAGALYFLAAARSEPPPITPSETPPIATAGPADEGAAEGARLEDGTLNAGSGPLGLATGEVAVAIERPLAPLPLQTGDVVELVAVSANEHGGASAVRLDLARVLALDDHTVTVAVPTASAVPIIEYRAGGAIEMILTAK